MSQVFGFGAAPPTPAIPPPVPRRIDADPQKAMNDAITRPREGRASTMLTTPDYNRRPLVNEESTLGGYLR